MVRGFRLQGVSDAAIGRQAYLNLTRSGALSDPGGHPYCLNPVGAQLVGFKGRTTDVRPATEALYPCRKCAPCLKMRSLKWAARACSEMQAAPRTWFGTFTFRPDVRLVLKIKARRSVATTGIDLDALPLNERYLVYERATSEHVTKFLKRLRKKNSLRYLLVAEPHKDGFPHYHALIHERREPILWQAIADQWPDGFIKVKLTQDAVPREAFYVTKYLTKHAGVRIRSSQHYGSPPAAPIQKRSAGGSKNEPQQMACQMKGKNLTSSPTELSQC